MALLEAGLHGRVEFVISTALVLEYEAVLMRPEHLRLSELTLAEVENLLDTVCKLGVQVKVNWQWRPQLEDPDDEMVLETALNGSANAIVTFNRVDFIRAAKRFKLAVLSPR
jgi:predicted nucleic acid-binding protein